MSHVELSDPEWDHILSILSDRPYREVSMLVLKVGGQLQLQRQRPQTVTPLGGGIKLDANGKEVSHE